MTSPLRVSVSWNAGSGAPRERIVEGVAMPCVVTPGARQRQPARPPGPQPGEAARSGAPPEPPLAGGLGEPRAARAAPKALGTDSDRSVTPAENLQLSLRVAVKYRLPTFVPESRPSGA